MSQPKPARDPFGGQIIGKYQLLNPIGEGVMGLVYLGEHVQTGARAAVKILRQAAAENPKVVKRFHREAQALVSLDHPNIIKFLDAGLDGDLLYIASELVEGTSLDALMKSKGRMDVRPAVIIMKGILSALQHAHEKGLVHRDIKPGNVLVDQDGNVKLIDFSIAVMPEAGTALTLPGQVLGSPGYLSPEQAQAKKVGPQADLYSCGILLYKMLTAEYPFPGKTVAEILHKHVTERPPLLRAARPDAPAVLEKIISILLEKKPRKRFRTAARTIQALDKVLPPK